MQALFSLNSAIEEFGAVYLHALAPATLKLGLIKLAQYDVGIAGIIRQGDVDRREKYLNIPVVSLDDLLPRRDSIAVIVLGSKDLTLAAAALQEYGFRHIFYDFMSETGTLYVFNSGQSENNLLALEGKGD